MARSLCSEDSRGRQISDGGVCSLLDRNSESRDVVWKCECSRDREKWRSGTLVNCQSCNSDSDVESRHFVVEIKGSLAYNERRAGLVGAWVSPEDPGTVRWDFVSLPLGIYLGYILDTLVDELLVEQ